MSEFWVASDLPCDDVSLRQARLLTAWCEAEVERACRESWSNVDLIDGDIQPDGKLPVNAFLRDDWCEDIGSLTTVTDLISDAAEAFAGRDGIIMDSVDAARVEKMLAVIEATIVDVRKRLPQSERTGA